MDGPVTEQFIRQRTMMESDIQRNRDDVAVLRTAMSDLERRMETAIMERHHHQRANWQQACTNLSAVIAANTAKIGEHDVELALAKGVLVSLIGNGDGSTGLVPRMQREMKTLGEDVSGIRSDMKQVCGNVDEIKNTLVQIQAKQAEQGNWTAQVKGGAIAARAVVGASVAVGASCVGFVVWLFAHGVSVK